MWTFWPFMKRGHGCVAQISWVFFAPRRLTNNKIHELLNLNLPLINQKHWLWNSMINDWDRATQILSFNSASCLLYLYVKMQLKVQNKILIFYCFLVKIGRSKMNNCFFSDIFVHVANYWSLTPTILWFLSNVCVTYLEGKSRF